MLCAAATMRCGALVSSRLSLALTIYAEPAGPSSAASIKDEAMSMPSLVIDDFVKVESNSLRGFAKVRTPSGLVFHDVAIHRQANAAWASPASKPLLNP
jgi:hypothetical protein